MLWIAGDTDRIWNILISAVSINLGYIGLRAVLEEWIMMQTRRTLLRQAANLSAGLALGPKLLLGLMPREPLPLTIGSQPPAKLPANFIGLGYEMSSVAPLGLLSPGNQGYVNLVRGLGMKGVIRVGGIVANYTRYQTQGTIRATPKDTVITKASLQQFRRFLDTIGWQAIWSLNFAQGTIDEAVAEARSVSAVLGNRLLCLELGNEVEAYRDNFRQPAYPYETYRGEFYRWHDAIVKAVPGAAFAAPDTAANIAWVERMAEDAHGDVQLLTTHYYFTDQNHGKADDLLHPDPRLMNILVRLRAASTASHIPWRMCETNSFSGGGLRGVSDTFLGALWTLDYVLLLAAFGCSGVNIETGVNQLGFISPYSPIQDDSRENYSAGIPYYGMLAFAEAARGCGEIVALQLPSQPPSSLGEVTGYALGDAGRLSAVAIINRGDSDVCVSLAQLGFHRRLYALRLLAPSLFSKTNVTLAGASVDENGNWKPTHIEPVESSSVLVPKTSAVVLLRSRSEPARRSSEPLPILRMP